MILFNGKSFNGDDEFDEFYKAFLEQLNDMLKPTPKLPEGNTLVDTCEMFDRVNHKKFVIKLYVDDQKRYKFTKESFDNLPERDKRIKELNKLMVTALRDEDYMAAAEIKRELDSLMSTKSDDEDHIKNG